MHESCSECGNYPCSCRDPRLTTWCTVCGAWSTRDMQGDASRSVCSNGHTMRWASCGGGRGRKHEPHDWALGHCHGQGVLSSTFIVYGRDGVAP